MIETTETIKTPGTEESIFRVGTLEYTKRGLFMLFVYLLWGDFCFTIMESVFPQITPLTMSHLGSSNKLISLVMITIPNIFNFVVCPWVSFKSDRHRSKMGRRIPFLLYPTPFIALFLILIGFSPDIGNFLFHHILRTTHWSCTAIILALIAIFSAGFQYFNMFVGSVYYYLFNDVVPEQFLGRFMSAFRIVGVGAAILFNFLIFPHAETHMKIIFIGAGVVYFIAFMQMSLRVKEGEYPPPPEYVDGNQGIVSALRTFLEECFSHKFYWLFFLSTAAWDLTQCIRPFDLLLQRQALGLSTASIGIILGCAGVLTFFLMIPAGVLVDKMHPLRMTLFASIGLIFITPTRLVYLFHHFTSNVSFRLLIPAFSRHTIIAFHTHHYTTPSVFCVEFALQMLLVPLLAIYTVSSLPMYMRILPSERYGQFCSAQAMFRSGAMMVFGIMAGAYMDLMKSVCAGHHMRDNYYYGFAPTWTWVLQIISVLLTLKLYKYWKQYGGDEHYTPPEVGRATKADEVQGSIGTTSTL